MMNDDDDDGDDNDEAGSQTAEAVSNGQKGKNKRVSMLPFFP